MTSILDEELGEIIPIYEEQGFRKNRSTTGAIFILWQIIEKSLKYYTVAYLCFIDLNKAFDRRLKNVIDILRDKDVYKNVIKIIKVNPTTQIKVNDKLTREIKTHLGIWKDNSLSSMLFNLIMHKVVNAARGFRMGDKKIKLLCYTNDAVLFAETEDDLQKLLMTFHTLLKSTTSRSRKQRPKPWWRQKNRFNASSWTPQ